MAKKMHIEIVRLVGDSFEDHDHIHYSDIIEVTDKSALEILKEFSIEVYECNDDGEGIVGGEHKTLMVKV